MTRKNNALKASVVALHYTESAHNATEAIITKGNLPSR